MFTIVNRKQFKDCKNMPKTNNVEVKKDTVVIQIHVSNQEYADIQRVKVDLGKARENNSDFYKELMLKGLQEIAL